MTRYRNQSSPIANGIKTVTVNTSAPVVTQIVRGNASSKQCYDEVIPNFKARSAKGEIFNNPVQITERTLDNSGVYNGVDAVKAPFTNKSTYNYRNSLLFSFTRGSFPAVELDTSGAAARASLSTIASVNKTEVDSGNVVGEWSKTKMLHRDLLNNVLKLLTSQTKVVVKRPRVTRTPVYDKYGRPLLNRKGLPVYKFLHTPGTVSGTAASSTTKSAADLYLTVRMGLLPLLSDLEGAVKALLSSKARRQTARGGETLQASKTIVMTVPDAYGVTHAVNLTTTRTWSIRYGILYESSGLGRAAGQFGLTRPLTSGWNLLPWSFVIDYFLNVGKWLDAIQPSGASRTLSAWVSTHETTVYTASVSSSWNKDAGSTIFSGSWNEGLTEVVKSYTRSPWVPTVPTSPISGSGITVSRAYDLAALVLQKIKSRI